MTVDNTQNTSPSVSVLMCAYNNATVIESAINSILQQSFTDFEFIIINDAATDGSAELLQKIKDPRLRIINQDKNVGLTASLIAGVALCKGTYIARIDADDIAHPERLALQVSYLNQHPDLILLGSKHIEFYDQIPEHKSIDTQKNGADNFSFDELLKNNHICHSSAMFRRSILDKGLNYRIAFTKSQDYDLWLRIVLQGQVARLQATLCYFRRSDSAISLRHTAEQRKLAETARILARQRQQTQTDDLDSTGQLPALSPDLSYKVKRATCSVYLEYAVTMLRKGKFYSAATLFMRALTHAPLLSLRVALSLALHRSTRTQKELS